MHTFFQVESTIEEALGELTETTVCVSILTIRKSQRFIYGKEIIESVVLENTAQPKYLGVTFHRSLSYKQHIQNTKMKVATHNNILKKLVSSKWRTNTRTTALALCYSIAEYVAPVWARSSHAHILDPKTNKA